MHKGTFPALSLIVPSLTPYRTVAHSGQVGAGNEYLMHWDFGTSRIPRALPSAKIPQMTTITKGYDRNATWHIRKHVIFRSNCNYLCRTLHILLICRGMQPGLQF
ncbi:hypothetical protein DFH27DRAFT_556245 [Peziza echinospora]|nr:hypothetical protein DFH27DRAFT_556245 [Peziza echinospora]